MKKNKNKFLVIGDPVKHSLSPILHNYWFSKYRINSSYFKKKVKKKSLSKVIKDIKKKIFYGANVTLPLKSSIIPHVDIITPLVKETNSVNTVYMKNGKLYGDNTDVFGFSYGILRKIRKKCKKVLIIGAGGVTSSVIAALKKKWRPKKIYIANRSFRKSFVLKRRFGKVIDVVRFENLKIFKDNIDLVINTSSLGLRPKDEIKLNFSYFKKKIFIDLIYNPERTLFLRTAKKFKNHIYSGLPMFIYQAQKSFKIWTNILPEVNQGTYKLLRRYL